MRIAFFNANLHVGQDGVTRVMYKMFEGALARDVEAVAFTSTLPEPNQRMIPMHKIPSVAFPLQKAYRIALPGYLPFVRQLRDFGPDILHVNSPCTLGFGALRYGEHFHVPVVATYHTHFPTYLRYYRLSPLEELTRRLLGYFYNRMERTFVPTRPILQELTEYGTRGLEYLPNGVDVELFGPTYRSAAWRESVGGERKSVVLFVSRLVWEKNLRVLAEAYRLLRGRRGDFEMVLVGDGPARSDLKAMMPGAHFLGYQSGRQLAESYASSDVFVFPSTTETFGLVTVEAMASGLVPVAARAGGAVGIIEEGKSGLFATPFNAEETAHRVEWLLDHPESRRAMAQKAMERSQEFRWERILDQLFRSYAEVIDAYGARRERRAARVA